MCRFKQLTLFLVFYLILVGINCGDPPKAGLASNRVDVTAPKQPVVPEETPSTSSPRSAPVENGTVEDTDFDSFKAAFRIKRIDQKDIVQAIKEMKEKKKDEALKLAVGAIVKSLAKSRRVLMQHNYQIGDWPAIPSNASSTDDKAESSSTDVRSALSSVIENVTFFCDIVLFFPDHVHDMLRRNKGNYEKPESSSSQIVKWAFTIANVDKFILSENDKERMNLALQELRYIPRAEDFTNPNSKEAKVEKLRRELEKKREDKKKSKEKEFLSEKARLKKLKYDEKMKTRKRLEL